MLNFKKRSRIVIVAAVALAVVLSVGFAVNRASGEGYASFSAIVIDEAVPELSALRTSYVGDNSAVGKIVDALPPLGARHTQRFFSIGDDYGTGRAPYTLTLYYEQDGRINDDYAITPRNAVILFALIDNLEEVNIAVRNAPSGDELDKSAYHTRVTYNRAELGEYLSTIGLTWDDFHDDWAGAAEKVFALIGTGELELNTYTNWGAFTGVRDGAGETRTMTLRDVRAIAEKIGPDLTAADLSGFKGVDIGSGFFILRYDIEGGEYQLVVNMGGGNDIFGVGFGRTVDDKLDETAIDIRYYDVDKYIADGTRELVRALPRIEPIETSPPKPLDDNMADDAATGDEIIVQNDL